MPIPGIGSHQAPLAKDYPQEPENSTRPQTSAQYEPPPNELAPRDSQQNAFGPSTPQELNQPPPQDAPQPMQGPSSAQVNGGGQPPPTSQQHPEEPVAQEKVLEKGSSSWAHVLRTSKNPPPQQMPPGTRGPRPKTGLEQRRPSSNKNKPQGMPAGGNSSDGQNMHKGGRRKGMDGENGAWPRGRGRGDGPPPGDRRNPQGNPKQRKNLFGNDRDRVEKPAVFFQAKNAEDKSFQELGINQQHVHERFSHWGKLYKVDVRLKYGFIYFESEEARDESIQAIKAEGMEINGVPIRVERKKPQPRRTGDRPRTRGARGRGRGREWALRKTRGGGGRGRGPRA